MRSQTSLVLKFAIGALLLPPLSGCLRQDNAPGTIVNEPTPVGTPVGPVGATITTPAGAVITFSAGAVAGDIHVQALDTVAPEPRYSVLSSGALRLVLPLAEGTVFRSNGDVQITLPLRRPLQPGAVGYVRAQFAGIAESFWARATRMEEGFLHLTIPISGFPEFHTLLGMTTLDVVLSAEEFTPVQPPGLGKMSEGTDPACPAFPVEREHALYAPCGGRLQQIVPPGNGSRRRIGIVLVHGWLPWVTHGEDYYDEQDLNCLDFLDTPLTTCDAWEASATPAGDRKLPAIAYFKGLISTIRSGPNSLHPLLNGAPLYVFDYQSYLDYAVSGEWLSNALRQEINNSGGNLDGFVLVGHSMGGLVSRVAAQHLENDGKNQAIRGIIALASPHDGTILPKVFVAKVFRIFQNTAGLASLERPFPRTEIAPLILYGGNINVTPFMSNSGAMFDYRNLIWTGILMCKSGYCDNDGAVPLNSALPQNFDAISRNSLPNYDHAQMGYESLPQGDPSNYYHNLLGDIGLLLDRAGAASLSFDSVPKFVAPQVSQLNTVSVSVRDGRDSIIRSPAFVVTLSLGPNPSGATLGGALQATTVEGVATFTGLAINKAGEGYTLFADAYRVPRGESDPFSTIIVPANHQVLKIRGSGEGAGFLKSVPGGIACDATTGSLEGVCGATYPAGTNVTINATAGSGSTLGSWSGCTTTSGNTCTVSMTRAREVTAHFVTTSPPAPLGTKWSIRTSGTTATLYSVTWGNPGQTGDGLFVAVGDEGTILTSPDGTTWTPRESGTTDALYGVTWSGTQFVAVGGGRGYGEIVASPDGVTWTSRPASAAYNALNSVAWSGLEFVAVGGGFLADAVRSPDGVAWEGQVAPMDAFTLASVAHPEPGSLGLFVAVGGLGSIVTASSGLDWTKRTSGITSTLWGVTWATSRYIAVGSYGVILTSPDAINWTQQSAGWSGDLAGVGHKNGLSVVVGVQGAIFTSQNGVAWTFRSSGTPYTLRSVAASGTRFIAVGHGGTIVTSP
jgi:pimeloyl-ACP methyl ester carboxylesterase